MALLAMCAIYFFSYFLRAGIPGTIFDEIQSDMALSASAVAMLGAMFTYVYGGMQVVVGVSVDRTGGQRALLFGGVIMAVGALLFPLSHSIATLYATRILTAFGASFMYLCIVKEVDLLFDKRHFAAIVGVVTSVGYMGAIAGTLPFERTVSVFGWRGSLIGISVLLVVCLALTFAALRGCNHFTPVSRRVSLAPIMAVLRNPESRPLLICGLINYPIYFVLQAVLGKKFLEDVTGLSPSASATFVMLMIVASAVMSFIGGVALRWMGHRRKPAAIAESVLVFAGSGFMLTGVLAHAPGWFFLVPYFLFALSIGCGAAYVALMKELNHPDSVGVSIAVYNGTAYIGAGMVGNLAGVVLDLFRGQAIVSSARTIYPPAAYATLFGILTVLSVVAVVAIARVRETRGESVYELPPQ